MASNLYQDPAGNLVVKTRAVAVEVGALAVIGLILPDKKYVGFIRCPWHFANGQSC